MKYKEIEFKYYADDISLTSFSAFCKAREPKKFLHASGYDHFYENETNAGAFCRHRSGPDMNELTFKRKTSDNNNFVRTERNISLNRTMSQEDIEGLCAEFGYKYNTSIFKNCFIYKYDWYTLVYYICYNKDMNELGRFFEIEMAEDAQWGGEKDAWNELVVMEKLCKPLGVLPQSRIKKSLFELYKND